MSTAVENGAFQRAAGGEEQGIDQGVWQVLSWMGCRDDVIVARCTTRLFFYIRVGMNSRRASGKQVNKQG